MSCCNLCGAAALDDLGMAGVRPASVTSDSFFCRAPSRIACCASCGHLQKTITADERRAIEQIYATYQAHHLSGGREQLVFPPDRPPRTRTYHCLEQCLPLLPDRGALLDIGAGNGAVLRTAHQLLPRWTLHAYDVGERSRGEVEALPGVETFWSGDFEQVPHGRFDLIVLWHTLEHVPQPTAMLSALRQRLAPGGRLLLQVPDIERNPFDMAVIDHTSHFACHQLYRSCADAGLRVDVDGSRWVHNCLTLMLSAAAESVRGAGGTGGDLRRYHVWLRHAVEHFDRSIADGPYAIFGVGMAGIWLTGELCHAPVCLIDEDPARVGQRVEGVPIVAPEDVPSGTPIVMSLTATTARALSRRLAEAYDALRQTSFIVAPDVPSGASAECVVHA